MRKKIESIHSSICKIDLQEKKQRTQQARTWTQQVCSLHQLLSLCSQGNDDMMEKR
jgi:hypothetical protein